MGLLSNTPNIVTDQLYFAVDGLNKRSYIGTGTDVDDLSVNKYATGLMQSGTTHNGTAWVFDGINDNIAYNALVTQTLMDSANGTIDMWVKPTLGGATLTIWSVGESGGFGIFDIYIHSDGKVQKHQGDNGTGNRVQVKTSTAVIDSQWVNIVITNGGTTEIYFDNVIQPKELNVQPTWWYSNFAGVGNTNFNTGKIGLRFFAGSASGPFNGEIGFVSHYLKELSAAERLQNFNALKDRFL